MPPNADSDAEEWFRTRRRRLIASAGGSAAAGAAGCLDGAREPNQRESPTPGHDHGGDHLGSSEPVERIDVRRLSASRRVGDTVYYHPDEPGPYADGEEAFADVPAGGTFVLGSARYDVASEGRLVREDPVTIRGTGWYIDTDEWANLLGSVLVNAGDDVVDKPVIDCDGPFSEDDRGARQNQIRNIGIIHEGPSSPAIRLRNFIFNTVADCGIRCRFKGAKGVEFDEWGFFSRMARCQVKNAADITVHVSGVGYAHEFYSNHIASNVEGARAALQTERQRTIIVGGEYAAGKPEGPPSIRFYNPGDDGIQRGGLVLEPGLEKEAQIEIDGESPFDDVQLYHTKLPPLKEDRHCVVFGRTNNSKVIYPILWDRSGYKLAHWKEESRNCGIISDVKTLRGTEYTDDGATNPYVKVTGSATSNDLEGVPTGVPTTVDYHTGEEVPVLHTGSEWKRLSATSFELTD
jgi:hypothetical protein